jgi:hypothetical protein
MWSLGSGLAEAWDGIIWITWNLESTDIRHNQTNMCENKELKELHYIMQSFKAFLNSDDDAE